MKLTLLNGIFFVVWFGSPILCANAMEVIDRKYILQDGGGWVIWAIVAALAWFLLTLLIPGIATVFRSPKMTIALVFWAALTGHWAGLLAIRLVNCAADSSEAQQASIAKVDWTAWRQMAVVTISSPSPGVAFPCPNEAWREGEAEGKRFFVHKGRLGLLWGELR
jgi:hypothetical protein